MKTRWFVSLFASVPIVASVLVLQSCAGVGGPTVANGGGGGTSYTQQFLALLTAEQKAATSITPEECADCHGGRGPDDPIYAHWKDTKHFGKNVGCESCHGPGSAHRAAPTKTNILAGPKLTSPVVCAQCHGPLHEQFTFSSHYKLIQSPVEEGIIDPNRYGRTSRCIACHSGVVRAEMESGVDLATATDEQIVEMCEATISTVPHSADCVSCHNPHRNTGNLTQNGEEMQLRKKVFNTDTTNIAPATTPAVFTSYDHICAQCHNGRGVDPGDAKLTSSTSRPGMHDSNQMQMLMGFGGVDGSTPPSRNTAHAEAPGQCTKCHMPDARHSFTVSFDKGCSPCHTAADAAARADTTKSEVLGLLYALKVRMENWALANLGDKLFWEYTSNITAAGLTAPSQTLVPIQVKRARHNYYFVVRSGDYGVHNAPYAKHLMTVANQNLDAIGAAKPVVAKKPKTELLALFEQVKKNAIRAEFADGLE